MFLFQILSLKFIFIVYNDILHNKTLANLHIIPIYIIINPTKCRVEFYFIISLPYQKYDLFYILFSIILCCSSYWERTHEWTCFFGKKQFASRRPRLEWRPIRRRFVPYILYSRFYIYEMSLKLCAFTVMNVLGYIKC